MNFIINQELGTHFQQSNLIYFSKPVKVLLLKKYCDYNYPHL